MQNRPEGNATACVRDLQSKSGQKSESRGMQNCPEGNATACVRDLQGKSGQKSEE